MDGLPPTIHIDELFPQLIGTSSYSPPGELFPNISSLRDPTIHSNKVSPSTHVDELYSTVHADKPSPSARQDELYSPPSIDDPSHKQDAWLKNQVNTRESDDEGHRPNQTNSTYANHIVWKPSRFKQNTIQNFNDAV